MKNVKSSLYTALLVLLASSKDIDVQMALARHPLGRSIPQSTRKRMAFAPAA